MAGPPESTPSQHLPRNPGQVTLKANSRFLARCSESCRAHPGNADESAPPRRRPLRSLRGNRSSGRSSHHTVTINLLYPSRGGSGVAQAGDDTPGPGLAARAAVRDPVTRRLVAEAIDRLLDDGPALGRPLADRISGSRLHNLKELRPGSSGTAEVRILFIFDPARNAVLLVAGDKSGRWDQWYRDAIPAAEAAYEAYLKGQR